MSRYYRNYNYGNYSGRRYYKRGYRSSSNDDIFSAVFLLPALIIFSFLVRYMSDIQNFFVKYWLSILNYIVVIFVIVGIFYFVISVIKKISNSSYRMSSTMIPTKSNIPNENISRMAHETISYEEMSLAQPMVSISNESIRDINVFLRKSFSELFESKEIFGISGFLRLLHPKILEDLVELTFKVEGFQIIERSRWMGEVGYRIAKKDGGIDLICEKDGKRVFVQIKANVNNTVNDDVIRNLHGSTINKRKDGDLVVIMTTTLFSNQAKKTALEDNIRLIDFKKLNEIIDGFYKNEKYRKTFQDFFENNFHPKEDKYLETNRECPDCGAPLIYRKNSNGRIPCYGCLDFCGYVKYLN